MTRNEIREGDIEALRRKRELEGKPLRSTIVRDGNKQIFYNIDKKGNAKVEDVVEG